MGDAAQVGYPTELTNRTVRDLLGEISTTRLSPRWKASRC